MRAIFALACLLTSVALGETRDCERNARGVFEDINCALAARDRADKELNVTYQSLLASLSPDEAKWLREAQRSWLSFVEADAKFVLEREGDGSLGQLVVVNNRERLTRERIEALQGWLPH